MTEKELLELKQEIEEAETEQTRLQTRKDMLMEKLEKDFGVKTIEAAQKKVTKLEKEIKDLDEQIDEATDQLEAKLDEAE